MLFSFFLLSIFFFVLYFKYVKLSCLKFCQIFGKDCISKSILRNVQIMFFILFLLVFLEPTTVTLCMDAAQAEQLASRLESILGQISTEPVTHLWLPKSYDELNMMLESGEVLSDKEFEAFSRGHLQCLKSRYMDFRTTGPLSIEELLKADKEIKELINNGSFENILSVFEKNSK